MEVYPELEEEGGIDGWGGSESLSVLANLAVSFADPAFGDVGRFPMVREALDVARWAMAD